jgi:hypothetical protein
VTAALAAAVLLAAGCSSGSSSGSGSPSAAATSSAASPATSAAPGTDVGLTATTMKVGIIADINNPLVPGLFKDSVNAIKAWAAGVNASGGLAGRQVVVDFCDSQLNPNATTNCVIKACQNDFALVGTSANALVDLSDIDGCKNAQGKAVGIANLPAFAFVPEVCDPDTYTLAGLGSYCATAKQSPSTYTVPVGDTRYLVAHNQGLHGIWLYDTDDPTFKLTVLPNLKAESDVGIKPDGQGSVHPAGQGLRFHIRLRRHDHGQHGAAAQGSAAAGGQHGQGLGVQLGLLRPVLLPAGRRDRERHLRDAA